MKRLLLAALFGLSFAAHDLSHAQVAAPQHELCAVAVSPAEAPQPEPRIVPVAAPVFTLPALPVVSERLAVRRAAPARAPPVLPA